MILLVNYFQNWLSKPYLVVASSLGFAQVDGSLGSCNILYDIE